VAEEDLNMASLPHPSGQGGHTLMRDLKWSHAEKTIARKAFNQALAREFEAVIREAKQMAAKIEQPSDLWDLEAYLTHRRKEIDRRYDYRYSVLTLVFGNLVREGQLSEEELHGLTENKLAHIRSYATLFTRLDAQA
jgi:Photoprotection regulator fluorescence recovery protein